MFRILMTVVALGMFTTALIGCRAEGEIETSSRIVAPN